MKLSVVVIGRNEGPRLSRCLESVRAAQPTTEYELIYVDSVSQDDSVERARAQGARVIEVQEERPTAALARNRGWQASNGEFILFLDGDCVLHSDFLSSSLSFFENPNVAILSGLIKEKSPTQSIFHRVYNLEWNPRIGFIKYCGGNALARRSVLEETGGFNPEIIAGEEPEMCQRIRKLGYSILQLEIPMVEHDLGPFGFKQYIKRSIRTGYAYASISHIFRKSPQPLWRMEARHNVIKVSLLTLLFIVTLFYSFRTGSFIPLLLFGSLLSLLILKTAYTARKKRETWTTSLLYGVHSHFQHLPMFIGQIAFWLDLLRQKKREAIEYK